MRKPNQALLNRNPPEVVSRLCQEALDGEWHLMTANRFVTAFACKFGRFALNQMGGRAEFHREAELALVLAAKRFDETRGASWRSYQRNFVVWHLHVLVRNAFVPHKRAPHQRLDDLASREIPAPETECDVDLERLPMLLNHLPPRERDMVERRYLHGESMKSIAVVHGCHHSLVSQRTVKAVRDLSRIVARLEVA